MTRPDPQTLETYRGYEIAVETDFTPENPWLEWCFEPPIAFKSWHHANSSLTVYDGTTTERGYAPEGPQSPLRYFTDRQLALHQAEIFPLLDIDVADFEAELAEDYVGVPRGEARRDYLENIWGENHSPGARRRKTYSTSKIDTLRATGSWPPQERETFYGSAIDVDLDLNAALFRLLGYPVLCKSTHGYSQGDYVEYLVVLTPDYARQIGMSFDRLKQQAKTHLDAAKRNFEGWMWGDVFGAVITDPQGDTVDDAPTGFYGDDHEATGLLEQARECVDFHIRVRRRAKTKRLKDLIRNGVPLGLRPNELPLAT